MCSSVYVHCAAGWGPGCDNSTTVFATGGLFNTVYDLLNQTLVSGNATGNPNITQSVVSAINNTNLDHVVLLSHSAGGQLAMDLLSGNIRNRLTLSNWHKTLATRRSVYTEQWHLLSWDHHPAAGGWQAKQLHHLTRVCLHSLAAPCGLGLMVTQNGMLHYVYGVVWYGFVWSQVPWHWPDMAAQS